MGKLGQSSSSGMVIAQAVVMSCTGTLGYREEVEVSGLMSRVGAGMSAMDAMAKVAFVLAIPLAET
jgi:hypothetical protein